MCLMVNPMRNNWHEMPEFIRFANKHNINIWFNTIHRPVEWAIWPLPQPELCKIYEQLSAVQFLKEDRTGSISSYNLAIYKNLVEVQIKNWLLEAPDHEVKQVAEVAAVTETEAKELFEKKMTAFVYAEFNEGEEQKKYRLQNLFLKTAHIAALLNERNGTVDFYKLVLPSPAGIFYNELEKRSVNSLAEDFEHRFIQQTTLS